MQFCKYWKRLKKLLVENVSLVGKHNQRAPGQTAANVQHCTSRYTVAAPSLKTDKWESCINLHICVLTRKKNMFLEIMLVAQDRPYLCSSRRQTFFATNSALTGNSLFSRLSATLWRCLTSMSCVVSQVWKNWLKPVYSESGQDGKAWLKIQLFTPMIWSKGTCNARLQCKTFATLSLAHGVKYLDFMVLSSFRCSFFRLSSIAMQLKRLWWNWGHPVVEREPGPFSPVSPKQHI